MPNLRDDLQDYFRKRGIRTRRKVKEELNFVGKNGKTSFGQMQTRLAAQFVGNNTEVATLGQAYNNIYYEQTAGSTERAYEAVYGDVDYTVPVAENPTNKEVLDQLFGNNNSDPTGTGTGVSASGAKETIGRGGKTSLNKSSLVEKNEALRRAQAGTAGIEDEDTRGIRGVDEPDAPIEPIA